MECGVVSQRERAEPGRGQWRTQPAAGNSAATTTNLVFTSANGGTDTTVSGTNATTGTFGLATIPSSAPIANVSARSTLSGNGSTTVGFVIEGTMPRRVLIRAVGPARRHLA